MALAAIDLGSRAPTGDPLVEAVEQMFAASLCTGSAFGMALFARARWKLSLRLSCCALLLAACAASLGLAWPVQPTLRWQKVIAASGAWSVDFPAPPKTNQRHAPTPEGEMPLTESTATARGATFSVQERLPPGAEHESAAALLTSARAQALASGRARVVAEKSLATSGDAAGLELLFRLEGRDFRARIYAVPPRVFALTVGPILGAEPETQRFLDSFQFSASPPGARQRSPSPPGPASPPPRLQPGNPRSSPSTTL